MDNYPAGADLDPKAPWNEEEIETRVLISMTISKSVTIKHDSKLNLDRYELNRLVKEQIELPTDNDDSWFIDDFFVIEE